MKRPLHPAGPTSDGRPYSRGRLSGSRPHRAQRRPQQDTPRHPLQETLGTPPQTTRMRRGDLPPAARVKKRRDFLRSQDRGFRFYSRFFTLFWLSGSSASRPRLGITVSTKVHKRSTKRNRIKRHVREVFRLFLQDLLPGPGDLIVVAKPMAVGVSYEEIKQDLIHSLGRIRSCRGSATNRATVKKS